MAGLGIAMMPTFLAGPAIDRGELVTLLDDYEIPPAGLYIVRPPPAEPVPKKIKVLTEIMVERFGSEDWDVTGPTDPRRISEAAERQGAQERPSSKGGGRPRRPSSAVLGGAG